MQLHSLETSPAPNPVAEEVRAELDAILASPAFRRSDRQSKFLRFVCEITLAGEGAKLNEILIAHQVFGRGVEYSPGEDSVVRRQAHSLRQKLHDYYNREGRNDSVHIELPVGRYVPAFTYVAPVPSREPAPVAEPGEPKRRIAKWVIAGSICALALVLFGVGWLAGRSSGSRPAIGAETAELWGAWLSDPAGAVICFSNPATAVVKQFPMQLAPDALPKRVPMNPQQAEEFREALELPPGGYIYLSPTIAQAKMGEAVGAVPLVNLFARAGVPVSATQSRFISWEDFRNQNLILLGHDEANRWLDPILRNLPLRLAVTDANRPRRIVNTQPRRGESAEYYIRYPVPRDAPSEDYALVSMITGLDGRRKLLLLNGLNTEGTEIALEYLTNPATIRELLNALHQAATGRHGGEWRFQAVLHAEVRDKVPTRAEIVALHLL
jgi:hypothetical protein